MVEEDTIYKFFSQMYDNSKQLEFVRAMKEGNFERAKQTLEELTSADSTPKKIQRVKIQLEGYKGIVNAIIGEGSEELDKYRRLGTPEELKRIVAKYEELEHDVNRIF